MVIDKNQIWNNAVDQMNTFSAFCKLRDDSYEIVSRIRYHKIYSELFSDELTDRIKLNYISICQDLLKELQKSVIECKMEVERILNG